MASMVVGALVAAWLAACVEPDGTRCGDTLCPVSTVCTAAGTCEASAAIAACVGKAEQAVCDVGVAASLCFDGVCRPVGCGTGRLHAAAGEVCADTNNLSGDGCSADCKSDESCGNGIIDELAGESCDDGNAVNGDLCQANCRPPRCGDGIVDERLGETCDYGDGTVVAGPQGKINSNEPSLVSLAYLDAQGNVVDVVPGQAGEPASFPALASCRETCQFQRCGDGIVDAGEAGDDGNLYSGDGVSYDCKSLEVCGNDYTDFAAGDELCDAGYNAYLAGDGCTQSCQPETAEWEQWQPARPIGRRFGIMTYDATDDALLIFGGGHAPPFFNDTWTFSSADGWVQRTADGHTELPRCWGGGGASDVASGKTYFWGCWGNAELVDDDAMWIYHATTGWRRVAASGPTPELRGGHGMVFHPGLGKVVIFGGSGRISGFLNDTWAYDEAAGWQQLQPNGDAGAPPARSEGRLAYDEARDQIVLFGGHNGTSRNDTWTFDGAAWSQVVAHGDPAAPPARYNHGLAFHPEMGRVVLFGGRPYSGGGWPVLNDTWTFDGTSWLQVNANGDPAAPPGKNGHGLVYWPTLGLLVTGLGEGKGADYYTSDLWGFDGAAWSKLVDPAARPSARYAASMVATSSGEILLFGGEVAGSPARENDLWSFDWLRGWRRLQASDVGVAPSRRAYAAMVEDSRRGKLLLFGGVDVNNHYYSDLWEYDRANGWVQLRADDAPSGPEARIEHAMAYDARQDKIVLYGGFNRAYQSIGDTWTYDAAAGWQRVEPATPAAEPPGRWGHAMAYDATSGRMVMFGGYGVRLGVYGPLRDTWEFIDGAWSLTLDHDAASGPPSSYYHSLTYAPSQQGVVLLRGSTTGTVAWRYQVGRGWSNLGTQAPLLGRDRHAVVFDPKSGGLVAFGGKLLGAGEPSAEVWMLRAPAFFNDPHDNNLRPAREDCALMYGFEPHDFDADGLAGCADPDCWGYCDPMCAPQVSARAPMHGNPLACGADEEGAAMSVMAGPLGHMQYGLPGGLEADAAQLAAPWPSALPHDRPGADAARPHCGDGHCNAELEARLCPVDCAN